MQANNTAGSRLDRAFSDSDLLFSIKHIHDHTGCDFRQEIGAALHGPPCGYPRNPDLDLADTAPHLRPTLRAVREAVYKESLRLHAAAKDGIVDSLLHFDDDDVRARGEEAIGYSARTALGGFGPGFLRLASQVLVAGPSICCGGLCRDDLLRLGVCVFLSRIVGRHAQHWQLLHVFGLRHGLFLQYGACGDCQQGHSPSPGQIDVRPMPRSSSFEN